MSKKINILFCCFLFLLSLGVISCVGKQIVNSELIPSNKIVRAINLMDRRIPELETFEWGNSFYVTNWKDIAEDYELKRRQNIISEDEYKYIIYEIMSIIIYYRMLTGEEIILIDPRFIRFRELEFIEREGIIIENDYQSEFYELKKWYYDPDYDIPM